ncbi:YfjI family protein [Brevibacterium paucivorans]
MTTPDITNLPDGPAWVEPAPLVKKPKPVAFPVNAFPKVVRDFIQETAESLSVPEALTGVPVWGALSIATQGRVNVQYKPDWTEPVVLHLMTIAEPGQKKSPALKHATAPLYRLEQSIQQDMQTVISERTYKKELLEEQLRALKKQAVKGGVEAQAEYEQAGIEYALFEVPKPPVLIADDVSTDKLIDLAGGNRGSIALASAEGDVLNVFAGKHSGFVDTQALTKGHSGEPISVHRLGREGVALKSFRLNVLLMLQPSVLERTREQFGTGTQGVLERFLFCQPETWVSDTLDTPSVTEPTREAYAQLLQKIGRTCWDADGYLTLTLTDGAREEIGQFHKDMARFRRPGQVLNQSPLLQGWTAKLTGQTLRLAGLLHMAGNPDNPVTSITENEMACAKQLAYYFISEAVKADSTMSGKGDMEEAESVLQIIKRNRFTDFNASEIVRNSGYKNIRELSAPLATLVDTGHIARVESQGMGRRAQRYEVSPYVTNSYTTQNPVNK